MIINQEIDKKMVFPKDEPLTDTQLQLLNDIVYSNHNYLSLRRLFDVVVKTCVDRQVKHIYRAQLERWLKDQEWFQLHHKTPKRKDARNVTTQIKKPLDMIQADLIVLGDDHLDKSKSYRYPYKYVLNIIDVYSRKLWSRPLSNSKAKTVHAQMMDVFTNEMKRLPVTLVTDFGNEFTMDFSPVKHIRGKPANPYGQAVVESVNRTVKNNLMRYMNTNKRTDWSNILEDTVKTYNTVVRHTALGGLTPQQVYDGEPIPEKQLDIIKVKAGVTADNPIAVGTQVRLRKNLKGKSLAKGEHTYTEEVYTVQRSFEPRNTLLRTYKVSDETGKLVRGVFNKTEMLPIQRVQPTPQQIREKPEEITDDRRRSARLMIDQVITPKW